MKQTQKLYYENPEQMQTQTKWYPLPEIQSIVVEMSPAFPEGGGQIGDSGMIEQNGIIIPFVDTQKHGMGRLIVRKDFPTITVEQQVRLVLEYPIPPGWNTEDPIVVKVDEKRHRALCRSHTAAHLVWLALTERFGNLYPIVRGCYIAETHGRFDLLMQKPTDDDLRFAEQFIADWVNYDYKITMHSLSDEPECRIWHAGNREIPCGGTHLAGTAGVGQIALRAKSKGKSGIRVIYDLSELSERT